MMTSAGPAADSKMRDAGDGPRRDLGVWCDKKALTRGRLCPPDLRCRRRQQAGRWASATVSGDRQGHRAPDAETRPPGALGRPCRVNKEPAGGSDTQCQGCPSREA